MLQYWLGEISEVYAIEGIKKRPFPVDSTVQITFTFASGVIGSFLLSEYENPNPFIPRRNASLILKS